MDMEILAILTQAVSACLGWFSQIFDSVAGLKVFYLVMFFVVLVFRFFINPFMGSPVGSDTAAGSQQAYEPPTSYRRSDR